MIKDSYAQNGNWIISVSSSRKVKIMLEKEILRRKKKGKKLEKKSGVVDEKIGRQLSSRL